MTNHPDPPTPLGVARPSLGLLGRAACAAALVAPTALPRTPTGARPVPSASAAPDLRRRLPQRRLRAAARAHGQPGRHLGLHPGHEHRLHRRRPVRYHHRTDDLRGLSRPAASSTTIQVPGGGWFKQGCTDLSTARYTRTIKVPDIAGRAR